MFHSPAALPGYPTHAIFANTAPLCIFVCRFVQDLRRGQGADQGADGDVHVLHAASGAEADERGAQPHQRNRLPREVDGGEGSGR